MIFLLSYVREGDNYIFKIIFMMMSIFCVLMRNNVMLLWNLFVKNVILELFELSLCLIDYSFF